MKIVDDILKILPNPKSRKLNLLKKLDCGLYNQILSETEYLDPSTNLATRLLFLVENCKSLKSCRTCGKLHQHVNKFVYPNKISLYCSYKCYLNNKEDFKTRLKNVDQITKIEKLKATNQQKYGVDFNSQRPEMKELQKNIPKKQRQEAALKSAQTKMKKYGYQYFDPDMEVSFISEQEIEIHEWLNSLRIDNIELNTFKQIRKQIDIFLPDYKIGIEHNGLPWHQDGPPNFRGKTYHYDKWKRSVDKGINLISIWGHEWQKRKPQIKSFIKSKLNIFEQKIYARDCVFSKIDKKTANQFLDKYHIQGKNIHLKDAYGLLYGNELIGIMCFGKHHRGKQSNNIVLNRLCYKDGVYVIGGSKKLFDNYVKYHLSQNQTVITWSDNRWSEGKVYQHLGFIKDKEFGPDYFYVKHGYKVKSKQSMQKKKIGCPPNMTEKEYCESLGYYRVWDCGKIRWKYSNA